MFFLLRLRNKPILKLKTLPAFPQRMTIATQQQQPGEHFHEWIVAGARAVAAQQV